jgi:GH24 family phage-related lysozyme (muramidase)
MRLKSANFKYYWHILSILCIILDFVLNTYKSHAASAVLINQPHKSALDRAESKVNSKLNFLPQENLILSSLPILPSTSSLIKKFEGFRSSAYIDSSGLPVIGYGQTRVNGTTVKLGQSISQEQADIALEQELSQIQQLVQAHVKVDLNPYQLGALTSLVYNAGAVVVKNSTLIKKLNGGDYLGAAQEFLRWNKANSGGNLVVFPGLTKRRMAERELFLTPHEEVASNN